MRDFRFPCDANKISAVWDFTQHEVQDFLTFENGTDSFFPETSVRCLKSQNIVYRNSYFVMYTTQWGVQNKT